MNSLVPFIVLVGAVAAGPAMAADRLEVTQPPRGDAQAAAATLLRAEVTPPSTLRNLPPQTRAASRATGTSAQAQAANLLKGDPSSSSARPRYADATEQGKSGNPTLAKRGGVFPDAQTQARKILRTDSA